MNNKPSWSLFTVLGSIVLGTIAFGLLAILLISLAHTTLLLVASLWTPIFLIFLPAATVILAITVVSVSHPVHSLLSLISVFFGVVVLYLTAGAEFLAFTFLIVYVGAIAILFLFVIMLLNVKELAGRAQAAMLTSQEYMLAGTLPIITDLFHTLEKNLHLLLFTTDRLKFATEFPGVENLITFVNWQFMDILVFGDLLYTYYSYLFMLIALLLLTAMLGAIVLATSTTETGSKE